MRALILVVSAALAVAACGRKDGSETAAGGAEDLTANAIGANDTTAIDAATGEDANMAADTDLNMDMNELDANNADNAADNAAEGSNKASANAANNAAD